MVSIACHKTLNDMLRENVALHSCAKNYLIITFPAICLAAIKVAVACSLLRRDFARYCFSSKLTLDASSLNNLTSINYSILSS